MQPIHTPEHIRQRKRIRQGTTATEVLVAATLLLGLIGTVVPTTVRTAKIWRDTRHFQIATNELSNQLELLSQLNEAQLDEAIDQLKVSEPTSQVLMDADLSAEIIDDSDGYRVTLSLNWERSSNANPLQMTGWLKTPSPSPTTSEASATDDAQEISDESK